VLGQSEEAARLLEVQDVPFARASARLLDALALRPGDRVVELGCGPGSFSRCILRRLGSAGVLVGVDTTEGLLIQARRSLSRRADRLLLLAAVATSDGDATPRPSALPAQARKLRPPPRRTPREPSTAAAGPASGSTLSLSPD
jgi:SAM-dependent methyltransferase